MSVQQISGYVGLAVLLVTSSLGITHAQRNQERDREARAAARAAARMQKNEQQTHSLWQQRQQWQAQQEQRQPAQEASPPPVQEQATEEPPQQATERFHITDVVLTVCKLMEPQGLVTECTLDINMFEDNWMVVYGRFQESEVDVMCAVVAETVAKVAAGQNATVLSPWQVRMHTPWTGEHPLAVCPIHFTHMPKTLN